MNWQRPEPMTSLITGTRTTLLHALYTIGRRCTRSELAGVAELTFKQMSRDLIILIDEGLIHREFAPMATYYELTQKALDLYKVPQGGTHNDPSNTIH